MPEQQQTDERTDGRGQRLAQREVADALAVALPGHHAGDDRSGGESGRTVGGAVKKADEEQQADAVRREVAEGQDQAEERSDVQDPGLAELVDPLSEDRTEDERADDEDARRQTGHSGGGAEAVGGDLRHDDREQEEDDGVQEVDQAR